jgi:hypothetical protein
VRRESRVRGFIPSSSLAASKRAEHICQVDIFSLATQRELKLREKDRDGAIFLAIQQYFPEIFAPVLRKQEPLATKNLQGSTREVRRVS